MSRSVSLSTLFCVCVALVGWQSANGQESFTYSYDFAGTIAGADGGGGTSALTDGIGLPGYEASAQSVLWDVGEPGVIYLDQSGSPVPQPRINLTLDGGATDLTNVAIYYFERSSSGITAPESITATINGEDRTILSSLGQIDDSFSDGLNGVGEIRVAGIDLSGLNSDTIQLDFFNTLPAPGDWVGLTEIVVNDPTFVFPELPLSLLVNRDSGEISLRNVNSDPVSLKGYSITSAAGSLTPINWTSIADSYDMDSQTGTIVDGDNNWTNLTDPASQNSIELSEFQFGVGDGGEILGDSTISLGSDAWLKSVFEDLVFEYVDPDTGEIVPAGVVYESTSKAPFVRSDLDTDGDIDGDDWLQFVSGMSADMSSLNSAPAYRLGDLDGDLDNDLKDLKIFQADYDAAQGSGAFAALISGAPIPEPSGLTLLGALVGMAFIVRRRTRHPVTATCEQIHPKKQSNEAKTMTPRCVLSAMLVLSLALVANRAQADRSFTYVYDVSAINGGVFGFDTADDGDGGREIANNGGMNNGIGLPGYTPSNVLWDLSEQGTIFQDNTGNPVPQPRITLTVNDGGANLNNVTVYYFERTGSAVTAPESIVATLGGDIRTITSAAGEIDVDQTNGPGGFGEIRQASIDLTGLSNDTIQLDLTNTTGLAGFNGEWTGITEIVIDEAIVRAQVDRSSGAVTLYNPFGDPVSIDGYQLLSAGDSLSTAAWSSLESQNIDNALIGDYNGDNSVNIADYTVWRDNLGASVAAGSGADGSGDGTVGPEDYDLWKENFGNEGGFGFGWFEGGSSHAGDVTEGRLIGTTEVVSGSDLNLGNLYDTSVDAQDLLFRYSTANGVNYGLVDYINAPGSVVGQSQVPEPTSMATLLLGGMLLLLKRVRFRSVIAAFGVVAMCFGASSYALELDRDYELGDNSFESAVAGTEVGSQFSSPDEGLTFDSNGTLGDGTAIDLIRGSLESDNNASYISVSDRPGAGATLGVSFDGAGDYLVGPRLGLPATSDAGTIATNPKDYAGISNRGFQFWAKPDSAGQGATQALVLDTNQHGVMISDDDTWVMRYGGVDTDTGVPVDFDAWSHVMLVRPSGPGFGATLYVDGEAIGAQATGYDGADNAPLILGANTGDTTLDPPESAPGTQDFYNGVLDNLQLFVFGASAGGTEYGEFDYSVDNPIGAANLNGVAGDVDQNGVLEIDDLNDFVAGWYSENLVTGVRRGDFTTILDGDLNLDGITDLRDAVLIDQALINAGLPAALAFGSDGSPFVVSQTVPEPTAWGSAAVGAFVLVGGRRRILRRRFTT